MPKRLFIVANRLPLTVDMATGATLHIEEMGGVINQLLQHSDSAYSFTEVFWAGNPYCSTGTWEEATHQLPSTDFSFIPVFIPARHSPDVDADFSYSVIWPLFHYHTSQVQYKFESYQQYLQVNQLFFESISKHLRPNDVVWIHDFQLLPLAGQLRMAFPELTIGFFLHIPFPPYDLFRQLPLSWQQELIRGMLGADLVGFQTADDATHFLYNVRMVAGLDHDYNLLRYDNRLISVAVLPFSIDYKKFQHAFDKVEIRSARESLQASMVGKKIIFSIDRLDYTQSILNRLKAYEHFLERYDHYPEGVVYILVIAPSSKAVQQLTTIKKAIDAAVSAINSKWGNYHWQPVIYQYHTIDFDEKLTLCTTAHLAFLAPIRDGMNLLAKEFIASRVDKKGVLILSETAGAARELTDALLINPNDIRQMADTIKQGLEMIGLEQQERISGMQKRLADHDIHYWTVQFLSQLAHIKKKQTQYNVRFLDELSRINLIDTYRRAQKRLLLLDYDGTLVPISSRPEEATPTRHLLQTLAQLSEREENEVYVISGRNSEWLDQWFGNMSVNLIAEHGAHTKLHHHAWMSEPAAKSDWKVKMRSIIEAYVQRCPHSFMEEKNYSLVWHYRNADSDKAGYMAMELLSEINEHATGLGLQIVLGKKVVEVRNVGIDKGTAVKKILANNTFDFILAAGDDYTDEDIFTVLAEKKNCFTIKVGAEASFATYNLMTPQMVVATLNAISHLDTAVFGR